MRQSDNSEAVVLLRFMESEDVAFLADLWVAAWAEAMPAIDFDTRRDWLRDFLRDPAHATRVAVADAPVGFVTTQGDYLHQLVVAPPAKGSGVAVRLLDDAKLGRSTMTLDVNQANARAVRFYQREGFAITGAGTNPTSGLATWRMCWRGP